MDKLGKTGVIPPPEKPELSATRGVVPSPHTQHICRQASAETTQDRVLLGHREKNGRWGGSLPHKTPPFYPGQISLWREKQWENEHRHYCTALIICCWQHNSVNVWVSAPAHIQCSSIEQLQTALPVTQKITSSEKSYKLRLFLTSSKVLQ